MTLSLFLMLAAAAGEAPPDPQLFDQARANMARILARQPNYVCIQTIDRSQREKPKAKFETIDSLRLEVAFVDQHEIYSWPGSKKFDVGSILDLVPEGSSIGTGAFAGHAQLLFRTNAAIVNGGYWVTEGSKRMARFLFTVPVSRSRYLLLKSRKEGEIVGYSGDIWIEPETARVAKIALHATDIPPRLGIQSTQTVIEYGETRIGEGLFWLPAQSTEEITVMGGRSDRNVTRFSGCRAFSGESTLRFDDVPEVAAAAAPVPAKTIELPRGIMFEIQLDAEVDTNRVHVGDPVPATLGADMKQKDEVLFAKGSAVEMRIVRIQRLRDWIGVEFALGEVTAPAAAARLWALPVVAPGTEASKGRGNLPQLDGDPKRPGLGAVFVKGNRLVLHKGFHTLWKVVGPPTPPNPKKEGAAR